MDGIRPPAAYLATALAQRQQWSVWYRDFELYAITIGWTAWDEQRKQALLLHCLGQEGRRLYKAEEEAAVHGQVDVKEGELLTSTISLLSKIFEAPRDAMTERVKFRKCKQAAGEDVRTYLTNLRDRSQY